MPNFALIKELKNTIMKMYKKLIKKKFGKGHKNSKIFIKQSRRKGIKGHMGIENKVGE